MANARYPQTSNNQRTVRVSFSFPISGSAGQVGTVTGEGVTSITKESGAGTYTVLFKDYYPSIVSFTGDVRLVSGSVGSKGVKFGAFTAANKTLAIYTTTNGSAANQTQNDVVSCDVEFKCSTV